MKTRALLCVCMVSSCVTTDEGRRMQDQITELQQRSLKAEASSVELRNEMQKQADELRRLLDEAKRITVSLADASGKAERVQLDIMQVQGKFEDIQKQIEQIQRNFGEYRSQSETKLGQISNTLSKNPPIPDGPEPLFTQAHQHHLAGKYADARYLLAAFLARYPQDAKAPRVQSMIGDSYFAEARYREAATEYIRVFDKYPTSEEVEVAIFKNGQSFLHLRYCREARTYFEQLLSRFPRSRFRSEAQDRLKEISRKVKEKDVCATK